MNRHSAQADGAFANASGVGLETDDQALRFPPVGDQVANQFKHCRDNHVVHRNRELRVQAFVAWNWLTSVNVAALALAVIRLSLSGVAAAVLAACGGGSDAATSTPSSVTPTSSPRAAGCLGAAYPDPAVSLYVLPWAVGQSVLTGLTNCSDSYHSAGQPDQFAFDFNMAVGTPFTAVRAGTVAVVVNSLPSDGGGTGNYVVVEHGDGTSGLYLHSPKNGIRVKTGDTVKQGDVLGVVGSSGLAGYPHLHFMVVVGEAVYPYVGAPISFRNASPGDRVLMGNQVYSALPY